MTIEEIQEAKQELNKSMQQAVAAFKAKTGLYPSEIQYEKRTTRLNNSESIVSAVFEIKIYL